MSTATKDFKLTDKDFAFLRDLIYKEVGIVLADHKRNMLYSRLTRRLRALKLNDFKDYCEYVSNHLDEDPDGTGVLVVATDGVTVDLGGAQLSGNADGRDPDAFVGVGIVVRAKGGLSHFDPVFHQRAIGE